MKRVILVFLIISLCFACSACSGDGGDIHKTPDELAAKAMGALYGYSDTEMLMDLMLPAIKNDADVSELYVENYSRMIRDLQSDGFQLQSYQETACYEIETDDADYIAFEKMLRELGCEGDFEFWAYEFNVIATYDGGPEREYQDTVFLVKMNREWYVLVIPFF